MLPQVGLLRARDGPAVQAPPLVALAPPPPAASSSSSLLLKHCRAVLEEAGEGRDEDVDRVVGKGAVGGDDIVGLAAAAAPSAPRPLQLGFPSAREAGK